MCGLSQKGFRRSGGCCSESFTTSIGTFQMSWMSRCEFSQWLQTDCTMQLNGWRTYVNTVLKDSKPMLCNMCIWLLLYEAVQWVQDLKECTPWHPQANVETVQMVWMTRCELSQWPQIHCAKELSGFKTYVCVVLEAVEPMSNHFSLYDGQNVSTNKCLWTYVRYIPEVSSIWETSLIGMQSIWNVSILALKLQEQHSHWSWSHWDASCSCSEASGKAHM